MSLADALSDSLSLALRRLSHERLLSVARSQLERARALGLVVARSQGDVDISTTLSAEFISPEQASERAADAASVLDGVLATARQVLGSPAERPLAERLFGHFTPLEKVPLADPRPSENVTIARVDWFLDGAGKHHALELNATIPAMQAYSDAAARAWIETLGTSAGLEPSRIAALVERNGSNAQALLESIVSHSSASAPSPSIVIVHRPGDPQIRELEALVARFRAAGHDTTLAIPEELSLENGQVFVRGRRPDILYRHIFARRISQGSALERIALGEGRPQLQNPINGHLEVKGLLAELSRRLEDESALPLEAETRARLQRVLPKTRLLDGADPQVASMLSDPALVVLKRSWDYGGKSVLLGREVLASEGRAAWEARVRAALEEPAGTWVVQHFVDSPRRRHLVIGSDECRWEEVFVDASTFTASRNGRVPGGGVVRFARGGVVNIVGGGGVAPLVSTEVGAEIIEALERNLKE